MSGGGTPRQKMINLMYLVLLALLAMNVTKEVLNAFASMDEGLVKTNTTFALKNLALYNQFDKALSGDPNKVRPYWEKAQAVRKRAKEMYDYLQSVKKEVILSVDHKEDVTIRTASGKDSTVKIINDVMNLEAKDDFSTPTNYFFGSKEKAEPGNKCFELKDKIKKYKQDLMSYIPVKDRQDINFGLNTQDIYSSEEEETLPWEVSTFYHTPSVADVAILSKMQNDVMNGESDIINALYKNIDVNSFKFDTLSSRVIANSNYVLLGDEYRAEIFLAAFSSTSNPKIILGDVDSVTNTIKGTKDSTSVKVSKGVGIYSFPVTAEGTFQYGGLIGMKDPADPKHMLYFPFKGQYQAARPAIVVSPDKMNVFYIGVDNPVSISVPGVPAENLQPSISGGNIAKKANGKYMVKVTSAMAGKECTINVSARTKDGVRSMGPGVKFRVKTVPDPVAEFMGKRGTDNIQAIALKSATSVMAKLDNFEFDLKFPVVSFSVSMNVNGVEVEEKSNSAILSDKQKELLRRAKRGNKVYIENVKVKKPDGSVHTIGSVNLKVI